ncbi:ComEC/Rec2 family competence protein [Tepidibacter thalassicus]|uniref:Metal-dependent hydrolase, beta-lactamase superfamily II n=1 Tax=Tepidibacter thalassicus DSM 15285 TaxID=1123350 RepID=A0A1M5NHN7_9FIRM|nr:ComEC/Rec2 family competence protein [Tepidibacter thalassicus]SHG89030.1 Metal-dependent hydrolase, beta-lactamase superfamily II [Tepidibacter thalassicus DSM 15285]
MKKIITVLILIFAIFLVGCSNKKLDNNISNSNLTVHFIDVKQGDSTLIISPDNKTMLIDAGDNSQGENIKNYLKKLNINKIDVLVGTHPDADHIGGLDYIINNFEINSFYMPRKSHNTKTFKDVLIAAKNKGLTIKEAKYGVKFKLGNYVKCEILNPVKKYGNDNNLWSAVIKTTYNNKSFLFTGDAEFKNEEDMIKSGANLKSDVLKLGHHGSSTSTSEKFLKIVNPDVAVISCKYKNKYGHPHKETLKLLKKYNIPLYRTDEQGNIVFYCDGNKIWTDKKPGTYNYYGNK